MLPAAVPDGAAERGLQLLARPDVVALQHLLDPAVEACDAAAGPGAHRRGQAVFDIELSQGVSSAIGSLGA
jgi:hypothetical protein